MVGAAARDPNAERGDLGAVDAYARRAGLTLRERADEIDHRLLEQADECLDLEPAPDEVDQRIEHHLPGAVVGNVAAAVHADRIRDDGFAALPDRIHGRMLEKPELIGRRLGPRPGKFAHRLPGRHVVDAAQALHHHKTMTTSGWSQSS